MPQRSRHFRFAVALAAVALSCLLVLQSSDACTRILWNNNKLAVIVGRTMDWPESTEPILTVMPSGMKRNGGLLGGVAIIQENPAEWTSKYGSLIVPVYGIGTADGLNERGLAGHMLYLTAADYGPRDPSKPGLQAGLWLQYVLDNAATVDEALTILNAVQIQPAEARGRHATVHLALEDAGGDSTVIEPIDGKMVVHHGRKYRVMTNDPTYDEQLALLAKMDFSKPSSTTPLPGNVNPVDRFQRASYYLAMLPEPTGERAAVAGMLAITRNVSVPFGAPYKDFGIYNTEYRTVIDLTARRYFFELTTSPNMVWVDLPKLNLTAGSPVLELNPDSVDLSGNVTAKFRRVAKAPF